MKCGLIHEESCPVGVVEYEGRRRAFGSISLARWRTELSVLDDTRTDWSNILSSLLYFCVESDAVELLVDALILSDPTTKITVSALRKWTSER